MADTMAGKATQRVRQLEKAGKTGVEIAQILLDEGYTIEEADNAFSVLRYVVRIEPFMVDVDELHVSDSPLDGIAAIFASAAPKALPSVVWRTKKEHPQDVTSE